MIKKPRVEVETSLERANNLLFFKGPRLSEIVGPSTKWKANAKQN